MFQAPWPQKQNAMRFELCRECSVMHLQIMSRLQVLDVSLDPKAAKPHTRATAKARHTQSLVRIPSLRMKVMTRAGNHK